MSHIYLNKKTEDECSFIDFYYVKKKLKDSGFPDIYLVMLFNSYLNNFLWSNNILYKMKILAKLVINCSNNKTIEICNFITNFLTDFMRKTIVKT